MTLRGFRWDLKPITVEPSGRIHCFVTSCAAFAINKSQSQVSDKVAFANAPIAVTPNGSRWLWSWAFAMPQKGKQPGGALRVRDRCHQVQRLSPECNGVEEAHGADGDVDAGG